MNQRAIAKRNQFILLVDDDRERLGLLNGILELQGYGVAIAVDGSSAVALLEECGPDLIILDTIMPKLDSFQILNLIRQRSNVPIIMLAARHEVTTLCRALLLGADDYVTKPFCTQEFLARIRAKLRRAGLEARPSASLTPPRLGIERLGQRQQLLLMTTESR